MRATLTIDDEPSTRAEVVACIRDLAARPGTLRLDPGRQHLRLFERLCEDAKGRGDQVMTP